MGVGDGDTVGGFVDGLIEGTEDEDGDWEGFGLAVGAKDELGFMLGEDPQSEAQNGPF